MSQARQDGITLRQWLPLIGLTCCAFVFNTSEFMPIGLLTDIAASFSLTEAQAGIMISVYAWGVMLLSLPLMMFASRFEFKRMLLGVLPCSRSVSSCPLWRRPIPSWSARAWWSLAHMPCSGQSPRLWPRAWSTLATARSPSA